MCERVIEMGKTGASKHEMAMELDIAMDTFTDWQNNNPEFSAAVKRSTQFSQAWWEKQGRLATFGAFDGFNATSFIFNMKNRFRDSWNDMTKSELSGPDGKPLVSLIDYSSFKK
jgi:hypothetical protein